MLFVFDKLEDVHSFLQKYIFVISTILGSGEINKKRSNIAWWYEPNQINKDPPNQHFMSFVKPLEYSLEGKKNVQTSRYEYTNMIMSG